MVVYSIKDLEKLSGVKAHTLRIWEKRYGIIQPRRTKTNIRYYLDEDLKLILNIALLNRNGYKISKIAEMSPHLIQEKVAEISDVDSKFENQLDSLTLSMIEMNEYKFNKIIDANIQQNGFESTMMEVIYPLIDKLSVMWMAGSIKSVQENFVSNIVRRKTIAALDQLAIINNQNTPGFIIFLPEGEKHELSLLFLHFLIRNAGFRVLNLGNEVSIYDILDAKEIYPTEYIFTLVNESFQTGGLQEYIDLLSSKIEERQLLLTGFQIIHQKLQIPTNCQVLPSIKEVRMFLTQLAEKTYAAKV
jgi:DNA-binding transcriptional MerR regulator